MMCGDGPKAREIMAQSGGLRTLIGLGDRQVADMAAARADAVDAAPGSMEHALREDSAQVQARAESGLCKRKLDLEWAKLDAEEATMLEHHCALRKEAQARTEEAQARILEAGTRKCVAQKAKEASEQDLEEARRKRRLDEAEVKRQAQLQEARQATQLQSDLESGAISEEAAARLQPRRVELRLEKYVETCLETTLRQHRASLLSRKKSAIGLAQELGKHAKHSLLNKVRFLAKPAGDVVAGHVTWFEEDAVELYEMTAEIVKSWTALPAGQITLWNVHA